MADVADGEPPLAWLEATPESYRDFGLRRKEASAIAGVAQGLLQYGRDHELEDEDSACENWAKGAVGLEPAPKLDPYVGSLGGIGPALLACCRILCGEETIKADIRVLRHLRKFGLNIPVLDASAGFVAAVAVA